MKEHFICLIFMLNATLLSGSGYASPAVDTIPSCILKMKQKDSSLIIDKYDYKGQRWFGISKILTEQELKKVNYILTINFYNGDCTKIANWRTGGNGIIRVDEILPDTIDKKKILKVIDEKVPESILQLAIKENAASITEYEYLGQTLYFLNKRNEKHSYSAPKETVSIESYYDKNGREIIYFQRANSPAFFRAQGWRPITVKQESLISKGFIWYNSSNEKPK